MRKTPSSTGARVGTVANGGKVWIMCQVVAEHVDGTVRTTRMWDRLANNSYVSDAYVVRAGLHDPGLLRDRRAQHAVDARRERLDAAGRRRAWSADSVPWRARPTTASTWARPATPRSARPPAAG